MSEAGLKAWLLEQLGMEDRLERFEALWQRLGEGYYVSEVLEYEAPPEDLLKEARDLLDAAYAIAGRARPAGRQVSQMPMVTLS